MPKGQEKNSLTRNALEEVDRTSTEYLLSRMETWQMDGVLHLLYEREKEKRTNGELMKDAALDVLNGWNDNKDLYEGDMQHYIHEWAGGYVEPYTTSVFEWYGLNSALASYADEALKEFGNGFDCVVQNLQMGMEQLLIEFATAVLETEEDEDD